MRRGQLIAYLSCSFATGVFAAFNNFTLTLWLAGYTSSYLLLSLVGNSRSFEGTLIGPAAGFWSDHVWLGRLGRRRPFILAGGLTSALLLALTPAIIHLPLLQALGWLPRAAQILVLAVGADFLFTLTWDVAADIHDALLVDLTGPAERNRVSALRVVVQMVGQVGILLLGALIWRNRVPDSAFSIAGALLAIPMLVTVVFVREPAPAVWAQERMAVAQQAGPRPSVWGLLRQYRGAAIFCLVAFFYWAGVNAILPLLSIYIKNILHTSTGDAQLLPALLLASTTLLALPMASLGNRYGKRLVISAGYGMIAVVGLAGLVITTERQGAIVLLIAGIGNAASLVMAIPLLADLVPRRHIGVAVGILAASGSLAAPIASLIAGRMADIYGPRVIFLLMSIAVTCALLLMAFVPSQLQRGDDQDGFQASIRSRSTSSSSTGSKCS